MFSFVDGYMRSFRKSGEELEQLRVEMEMEFGLDDEPPTSTKSAAVVWLKTTLPQLSRYSLPTPLSAAIAVLAVVGLVAAVVLVAYLVFLRPRATQDSARVTNISEIDVRIETRNELEHPLLPKKLPGIPGNQHDRVVGLVTKNAGTDESKV